MKQQIIRFLLAGLPAVALAIFPNSVFADVIFVDQDAAGANNGSSWANAYISLQDALDEAAAGDEIWVAEGVYKPSAIIDINQDGIAGPREAVFFIPPGVALYGGFNGSENNLGERDWQVNFTILSGDIDNNDLNGDGNFIAENPGDIAGNNSFHVLYTLNADASTRIDGFVVTAGKADFVAPPVAGDANQDGGGWHNRLDAPSHASSPSVANTTFTGNFAESEGGAFYSSPGPAGAESSSLIENCRFEGNFSNNAGGAIVAGSFSPGDYQLQVLNCRFVDNEAYRRGGAIYLVGDHATISSSWFEDNRVTVVSPDMSTLPGSGGAVSLVASNAAFSATIFLNNSSTGNPTGAFEGGGGGAVYMSTNDPQTASLGASAPQFTGCGFYQNTASGNTAAWGGAIVYLNDGGVLQPRFVNCVFSGNNAQNHGGAVAGFTRVLGDPAGFTPLLEPEYTNCTFYDNTAGQLGGAVYHSGYDYSGSQVLQAHIVNSILWGNDAGTNGDQIYSTGDAVIGHSLVEGSGGSGGGWDASLGADGGGNIDSNAGFVNAAQPLGADNLPATNDDGLRLTQFSDAVNAGDNAAPGLAGITEDFAGALRIISSVVDMGAYERSGFILPDFDFVWLIDWPQIQPPCLSCPLPWSFLLFEEFGFDPEYIWKEPAKFMRKGKGAIVTGEIVNAAAPEISFKVYLKLDREHTWKTWSRQQGTWFSKTSESENIAQAEHVNWKFWKLSTSSYLEGIGDIRGVLKLRQWTSSEKTGFQMGMGANAWDADFGMAGYFVYNGKLKYNGKKLQVKGLGSFNADGVPCEAGCEEEFGQQAFAYNPPERKNALLPEDRFTERKLRIYPVPADDFLVLEFADSKNEDYTVSILDASGRLLFNGNWEHGNSRMIIGLEKLNSGLHFIHVKQMDTGEMISEKFVRK